MQSYLAFKNTKKGLQDVANIVKVIEKVAAFDMRNLKQKLDILDAYTMNLSLMLGRLISFYTPSESIFFKKNKSNYKVALFVTSDKSLVGDLWHKMFLFLSEQNKFVNYNRIFVLGNKGVLFDSNKNLFFDFSLNNFLEVDDMDGLLNFLLKSFINKSFGQVDIFYSHFISVSKQIPKKVTFLPFGFDFSELNKADNLGWPIFENRKNDIFNVLMEKYIKSFFYQIFLNSRLSEYSARTLTAERANFQTKIILQDMVREYQKNRKKSITEKQLEVFLSYKK